MIRRLRIPTVLGAGGLVLAAWLVLGPGAVRAASITVGTAADSVADDGQCSFREAIDNANDIVDGIVHDDCSPGTASGADVITFADGLGTVTIALNGTQLPQITSEMTIDGGGDVTIDADGVTDDGIGESRHFQVAATGNLTATGLTLQNGFVQDSEFLNIDGGSIHNSGTLTVTDSTLSDNIAQDNLGQPLESGGGGAIYNNGGTVTITGSTLTGNDAAQNFHGGGAILSSQGTVTISDSVLSGNSSARDGGALMALGGTLTVSNSILSGNSSGSGGAIAIFQAHVTVTNSSLSGNTAGGDGGAIFTLQTANVGSVTITGSTLSDNHAGDTGGAININFAVVTIDNTTFSGNTGRVGGAIDQNGATLTVTFSTFAGNSTLVTNVAGGAIAKGTVNVGTATVTGSLVTGSGAQCAGTIGGSNNLVGNSDASCGAAFTAVADVMIRSLADNGGTATLPGGAHTQTHLPLPASPAIDAAAAGCPPPASDQRGVTRPQGAACDIGSVELSAADPVVSEVVTTILDEANYVAACTLRDAITANLGGTVVGNCEPAADGVIRFAAILLDDPGNTRTIILNGSQLPAVTGDISLDGEAAGITVDANNGSRHFEVTATGSLTLARLTLKEGYVKGVSGGSILIDGGTVTISDSTLSGNEADHQTFVVDGHGGGIHNVAGTLTVSDSTLSGNVAFSEGGAINNAGGTVTVTNSTLSGNVSILAGGGAIESAGTLTITGTTFSANVANENGGAFESVSGTVTVSSSTMSDNRAGLNGGAIDILGGNLTLNDSTVSGNRTTFGFSSGGGITVAGSGAAAISNTTFIGNTTPSSGGAVFHQSSGAVTIDNSTLSGNSANNGGAINNQAGGPLTVTNTTFSANSAPFGGAIVNFGTVNITNTTFSGNAASILGAAISNSGTVDITNSLLANSTAGGNCGAVGAATWSGVAGSNLSDDATCGALFFIGEDDLGALADNGGTTLTHKPGPNTDAANAGDDGACPTADQRGQARGGPLAQCDIGSVELEFAADDDSYAVDEDETLVVAAPGVLGNDASLTPLTATLVSGTSNGTLDFETDGSFTYTPNADFSGTDSFTYEEIDGIHPNWAATVTITVTAVNDAPVAQGDNVATDEDTAVNIDVLANDSDIDIDDLTPAIVNGPTSGIATVNPDGTITYTPDPNFNGNDSFTYTANDGSADSNEATVTITINPVNDPPVADDETASTIATLPVTIDVLNGDTDIDGDTLFVSSVSDPPGGTAVINGDGTVTYTADVGFDGEDSFTYTVSDGNEGTAVAQVTVTVRDPLAELIAAVAGLDVQQGVKRSLEAKVQAVAKSLEDGDATEACEVLQDFSDEVAALTGKKLSQTQSAALLELAGLVREEHCGS